MFDQGSTFKIGFVLATNGDATHLPSPIDNCLKAFGFEPKGKTLESLCFEMARKLSMPKGEKITPGCAFQYERDMIYAVRIGFMLASLIQGHVSNRFPESHSDVINAVETTFGFDCTGKYPEQIWEQIKPKLTGYRELKTKVQEKPEDAYDRAMKGI